MKKSVTINGITFIGEYSPEEPMVRYLRNGDPGYPGSPAEFDIEKIEGSAEDVIKIIESIIDMHNKALMSYYHEDIVVQPFMKLELWEELENLCLENMEEE